MQVVDNWLLFDYAVYVVTSAISHAYDWVSRILFAISPMGAGILIMGLLFWSLYRFILSPFLGGKSYDRYEKQLSINRRKNNK